VWPEHDELEVRLMMDLIRHVTGTESTRLTPELLLQGRFYGQHASTCHFPAADAEA